MTGRTIFVKQAWKQTKMGNRKKEYEVRAGGIEGSEKLHQ